MNNTMQTAVAIALTADAHQNGTIPVADGAPVSPAMNPDVATTGHKPNDKAVDAGKDAGESFVRADQTKRESVMASCKDWTKPADIQDWLYGFSQAFPDKGTKKTRKSEASTIFDAYALEKVTMRGEVVEGKQIEQITKSGAEFLNEFNGVWNAFVKYARDMLVSAGKRKVAQKKTPSSVKEKTMGTIEDLVNVMTNAQALELIVRCLDRLQAGNQKGWEQPVLEVSGLAVARLVKSEEPFFKKLAVDLTNQVEAQVNAAAAASAVSKAEKSEAQATEEIRAEASAETGQELEPHVPEAADADAIEGEFETIDEEEQDQEAA